MTISHTLSPITPPVFSINPSPTPFSLPLLCSGVIDDHRRHEPYPPLSHHPAHPFLLYSGVIDDHRSDERFECQHKTPRQSDIIYDQVGECNFTVTHPLIYPTVSLHPEYTLTTHPLNTPSEHTLNTHLFNTPFQHLFNTPFQHTFSTHLFNTPFQHSRVGNAFFVVRIAVECALAISCILLMRAHKSFSVVLSDKYWEIYLFIKHFSEIMVLSAQLVISTAIKHYDVPRVLQTSGAVGTGVQIGKVPVPSRR